MRVSAAIQYLRAGPIDASTESGRSAERYRLAALSILANVLGRGVGMVVMVLGVSWTVPYLGAERFGVWITIASFATMLAFLDLGTGNALTNHVAKCAAKQDADGVRWAISGGLGFLAIIGLVVGTGLTSFAAVLPWDRLVKSNQPLVTEEARQAAIWFGVLFGVNIFASGVQKVFAGLQRGFEAHAATAIGSLLSLGGLWVCTSQHAGIPTLLFVTLGSQVLSAMGLLAVLVRRGQFSWNAVACKTRSEGGKLMKVSSLFLVLQLGVMLGWGADSLIVSSTLGAAQVAVYGITQRLLQFVSIPLSMLNSPLWAAYADAYARGDSDFMRRTLRKSLTVTLILAVLGIGMVSLVAQPVIAHWTKGNVVVPQNFLLVFSLWTVLEATGNAFAMFLNGCGIIRPQVSSVLFFCVLATPLKFLLAAHQGLTGVMLATIVCYLITVVLLYTTLFRSTINDALHAASRNRQDTPSQ